MSLWRLIPEFSLLFNLSDDRGSASANQRPDAGGLSWSIMYRSCCPSCDSCQGCYPSSGASSPRGRFPASTFSFDIWFLCWLSGVLLSSVWVLSRHWALWAWFGSSKIAVSHHPGQKGMCSNLSRSDFITYRFLRMMLSLCLPLSFFPSLSLSLFLSFFLSFFLSLITLTDLIELHAPRMSTARMPKSWEDLDVAKPWTAWETAFHHFPEDEAMGAFFKPKQEGEGQKSQGCRL